MEFRSSRGMQHDAMPCLSPNAAAAQADLEVVAAALLGLLPPASPCCNDTRLAVRVAGELVGCGAPCEAWARPPELTFAPVNAGAAHALLLLEPCDAPSEWSHLRMLRCNLHGESADELVPPAALSAEPCRRLLFLCCEQSRRVEELAPANSTDVETADGGVRIRPSEFLRRLGLRVVGLSCVSTPGADAEPPPSWAERWAQGGRFLRWMLCGESVEGWSDFAAAPQAAGFVLEAEHELEFATLATAWHVASRCAAAAAEGDGAECARLADALQALLEAAQRGDAPLLDQLEARCAAEVPCADDLFPAKA